MKKNLFFLLTFMIFLPVSSVWGFENNEKIFPSDYCSQNGECYCKKEKNKCKNSTCKERIEKKCENTCDKCEIEDDEYCVYNQCYMDKHYRKMKKGLNLSYEQEENIDNCYKNFKIDFESWCLKYKNSKNKLLDLIECEHRCYKNQEKIVKELKKELKEIMKDYMDEVKLLLCKEQKSKFNNLVKGEKSKFKKIKKYSAVYKLPCTDCCSLK